MKVSILKENRAFNFDAGAIVATATASEGTAPYTYSLITGSNYFNIDSSTGVITVIADMDIDNIQSFSVKAVDSNLETALTANSVVTYPDIVLDPKEVITSANKIYKITQDIDLLNTELTIPANCTLDFQGGRITNGTVQLTNTKVLPNGYDISGYITATITGTYAEGQILYDAELKKMKLWNGSAWVNMDGTALAEANAIEEVPASQDITY